MHDSPGTDPRVGDVIQRHVVVDVPGWHDVKPRIPDTVQRAELEKQRSIRQIVFGMQDGIITTLGIATGVGQAGGNHWFVLISGLVALVSGSLSMGVGEYLGSKSEREVVRANIELEKREMEAHPQEEYTEQVSFYKQKGFSATEAEMIVSRLIQHPDIYLYEMMRDEFGIDPRLAESENIQAVLAIALSFAAGALLPVLPYFFDSGTQFAVAISVGLSAVGLFSIGYYAGRLSNRNRWLKGLEIVAFGALVFGVTYAVGRYIPPLFGHPPLAGG
jgi:vacuolar iron transporter family protein